MAARGGIKMQNLCCMGIAPQHHAARLLWRQYMHVIFNRRKHAHMAPAGEAWLDQDAFAGG